MNNYAELFPILKYQNGVLTRINGSGNIIAGNYALFPLFSTNQETFVKIEDKNYVWINGVNTSGRIKSLIIDIKELPDPCFLVATRYYGGYSVEELESLNKIWNDLMSKLWKLKLRNLMKML